MSWETYVTQLENDYSCVFAGIFDHSGNAWAISKSGLFTITPAQIAHIVKGMQGKADLRAEGPRLGDRKFLVVEVTDKEVVMKQLGGDSNGKVMAAASLGKQCCVLAIANAGEHEKKARSGADTMGDYLRNSGY